MSAERVIREAERKRRTGLSPSTWRRLERAGLVPKRRRIGRRAVGWLETELLEWLREVDVADERQDASTVSERPLSV